MRLIYKNNLKILALAMLCWTLCTLSGCAFVGPKSISAGRMQYNETINRTEDEQMLLSIVKSRYGETFSLLAVNGVAASVRFRTNAAVEAGFGPDEDYLGNLVPFSAGMAYEENPTITYTPIQGEQYLRQLMSPIPLDIVVLVARSETNSSKFFTFLMNRINDMENPDFQRTPSGEADLQFKRFVELSKELDQAGILQLVEDPGQDAPFDILISNYSPAYTEVVKEYLTLLGISVPSDESDDIVLPVYFAVNKGKTGSVAISTRSTYDLIEILSAAIDIPTEHVEAGFVRDYPEMGLAGKNLNIRASKDKPKQASVAVKYLGYWFYIDKTDMDTKQFYVMVRTLWSVGIAAAADEKVAPVLTIPVGG